MSSYTLCVIILTSIRYQIITAIHDKIYFKLKTPQRPLHVTEGHQTVVVQIAEVPTTSRVTGFHHRRWIPHEMWTCFLKIRSPTLELREAKIPSSCYRVLSNSAI